MMLQAASGEYSHQAPLHPSVFKDPFVPMPNPLEDEFRGTSTPNGTCHSEPPQPRAIDVLELACGRGGDISKWTQIPNCHVDLLVGVDLSSNNVQEWKARLSALKPSPKCRPPLRSEALVGDMAAPSLVQDLKDALQPSHMATFDLVAIQFALHYVCDSEARLDTLLESIKSVLKPGGYLLLTFPDPRVLCAKGQGGVAFGNSIYSVEFPDPNVPPSLEGLGQKYCFRLSSAVERCDEYLVDLGALESSAKRRGLDMVSLENFGSFVGKNLDKHAELLQSLRVEPPSEAEWEAIQFYCACVLRNEDGRTEGTS